MKFFRVNEGSASGMSEFWEYFALEDAYDISEAKAMFEENNSWVHAQDCRRSHSEEITEEQYKTGLQFNRMFEFDYDSSRLRRFYNLYPTEAMAKMFAKLDHKSGYVRIGFPNMHNVYKVNQDGNFIFVYHHYSDRVGVLPNAPKP